MKVRQGFVSNSSSSSFICDACGQDSSGWDLCMDEAGMFQCENGHTICDGEKILLTRKTLTKWLLEKIELTIIEEKPSWWNTKEWDAKLEMLKKNAVIIKEDEFSEIPENELEYYAPSGILDVLMEKLITEIEDPSDEIEEHSYGIANICCPICNYKTLHKEEALKAIKKHFTLDDNDILEIMKKQKVYG